MQSCWLLLAVCISSAFAQDAQPPYYSVETVINSRFATTIITIQLDNTGGFDPLSKDVPIIIPGKAFITNLTMEGNDGVRYGQVMEETKAQEELDYARERGRSGAVAAARRLSDPLDNPDRDTNEFELSLSVEPDDALTVYLTYQEILYRKLGLSKYFAHVPSEDDFPDFDLGVVVSDSRRIGLFQVPEVRPGNNAKTITELEGMDQELDVEGRIYIEPPLEDLDNNAAGVDDKFRMVSWLSDTERPEASDLVLLYDLEYDDDGNGLDSDIIETADGFFVHFLTPTRQSQGDKNIVFVLDKSGSMRGDVAKGIPDKFVQLKLAMRQIILDLAEKNKEPGFGDKVNFCFFSTEMKCLYDELRLASDPSTIADAHTFVEGEKAKGWTNIPVALKEALDMLSAAKVGSGQSNTLTSTVFFLTDGLPVIPKKVNGQWVAHQIPKNEVVDTILEANRDGDHQIHALAFGNDADWETLKGIATDHYGLARRIYSDSDANVQLKGFYDEVDVVSSRDMEIRYLGQVSSESLVINSDALGSNFDQGSSSFNDITMNDGSQVVVVGRRSAGRVKRQTKRRGGRRKRPMSAWLRKRWAKICKRPRQSRNRRRKCKELFGDKPSSRPKPRRPSPAFTASISAKTSQTDRRTRRPKISNIRETTTPKRQAGCIKPKTNSIQKSPHMGEKKRRLGHSVTDLAVKVGVLCETRTWNRRTRGELAKQSRTKRQAGFSEAGSGIDLDKAVPPAAMVRGAIRRFWAYQTVQRLLEDATQASFDDGNDRRALELEQRALMLSLKYSFVNELTSMVVTGDSKFEEVEMWKRKEILKGNGPSLDEAKLIQTVTSGACSRAVSLLLDFDSNSGKLYKIIRLAGTVLEKLNSGTVDLYALKGGRIFRFLSASSPDAARQKLSQMEAAANTRDDARVMAFASEVSAADRRPDRLVLVYDRRLQLPSQFQQRFGVNKDKTIGVRRSSRQMAAVTPFLSEDLKRNVNGPVEYANAINRGC